MSDSPPVLPSKPQTRLWIVLLAIGGVAFIIFALSLGGLTWWLVSRTSVRTASTPAEQGDASAAAAFTEIFNGRDLDGWDFDPSVWSVRNGVIYGNQKRGSPGRALFWHDSDVADFELRFRFRLVRGNSGVAYRSTRLANFDVGGYEFEIYTNKSGNLANVGNDRERHRLYRAADTAEPIDTEWHEGVIIANGPRLIHVLDGKTLCDVEDTDPAAPRTGVIAFGMSTGTAIEFKDLRLKRTGKTQ